MDSTAKVKYHHVCSIIHEFSIKHVRNDSTVSCDHICGWFLGTEVLKFDGCNSMPGQIGQRAVVNLGFRAHLCLDSSELQHVIDAYLWCLSRVSHNRLVGAVSLYFSCLNRSSCLLQNLSFSISRLTIIPVRSWKTQTVPQKRHCWSVALHKGDNSSFLEIIFK